MRILIIEDEAPDMASHRRIVEDAVPNAAIFEAGSLDQARSLIAADTFDVAIVDLNLIGDRHAGQEAIRAIQDRSKQTAIIVISGLDVETFRPLLYAADVWDYFEKPMDARSLKLKIAHIVQRKLAHLPVANFENHVPGLEWSNPMEKPRWKGQVVRLSESERKVLSLLVEKPNQIVSNAALYDVSEHWDRDPDRLRRSLITMMSSIRKEFRQFDPEFDCIVAAGGSGYSWQFETGG